ncbi:uncharacterized protein [Epargyreus clarus]|uniref:uncharacterized protein n=1 Tax=Epargyreus clarus TaxID=520877 RepID=UPI003C2C9DA1
MITEEDKVEWTNELTLQFLDLYRSHPCIWDPKNDGHKNKSRLNTAWMDIKNQLGGVFTVQELKRKKESLMAAYRGYRAKIKMTEMTGSTVVYEPSWFAFPHMDAFLRRVYKVNRSFVTKGIQHKKVEVMRDPIEIDVPILEKKPSLAALHNSRKFKQTRSYKIGDLQQARERMDQAFSMLKTISKQVEEDESHIFGKLIAEKLRRLPEERRDMMMIKISKLFYKECSEYKRPCSSSSIRTYLHYDTPSPISPNPVSKIEQEDVSVEDNSRQSDDSLVETANGMECEVEPPNDVVTVFENSKDMNHFIIFKK